MQVKVTIPEELKSVAKQLDKESLERLVAKALKEESSKILAYKVADELLKKSRMTEKLALRLGDELKERVAKRHGL